MESLWSNHFNALLQIIKLAFKIMDNFVITQAIIHGAIHILFFQPALLLMEPLATILFQDGIIHWTIIMFH